MPTGFSASCRTSTDVARRQEGISFLLIDMQSPGVSVKPIITIDGSHEINEVHLENVRVPANNLIGEEGKGWTYGKVLLQHERTGTAGVARTQYRLRELRAQTQAFGTRRRAAVAGPQLHAQDRGRRG